MVKILSAMYPKYFQDRSEKRFRDAHEPLSHLSGTALSALKIPQYKKSLQASSHDPISPLLRAALPYLEQSSGGATISPSVSRLLQVSGDRPWTLLLSLAFAHLAPDLMASVGSSSTPMSVEVRLAEIQQSLDALKLQADAHGNLLRSNIDEDNKQWKKYSSELRSLKNDFKDSKGEMNYFKDVVYSQFKDAANVSGDFGNRIIALETAVNKLIEKLNSKYLLCSFLCLFML